MHDRSHDLTETRARVQPVEPVESGPVRRAVEPPLLQLQRTHGNRFVQRLVAPGAEGGEVPADLEQRIDRARGSGRPLDAGVREGMETAFGADFGGVRVHAGDEADGLSRELSARAFTTGSDVFFAGGEYAPGTSAGQGLIAHELAHVVQQAGGAAGGAAQGKLVVGASDDRFEHEAEAAARSVSSGVEAPGGLDGLTADGEEPGEELDEMRLVQRTNGDAGVAAPAATAVPTNLQQIVTSWSSGSKSYGFQLKFRCSSSTGKVADLVARPGLAWGEYVTYSRNDFSHRIAPPNPTILPPTPISFSTYKSTSGNVLELTGALDTHWMPNSAIVEADFVPTGTRALPAIMESSQIYRFTTDGGTTWTTFAGPFTLRRTLYRSAKWFFGMLGGNLRFTTDKVGIKSTDEAYKP